MFGFLTQIFNYDKSEKILSRRLQIPLDTLLPYMKDSYPTSQYHTFQIPKKKFGQYRQINAPLDDLKKLQKQIYLRILKYQKPHPSCNGFMIDRSIVSNALPHVNKNVVVNIDLKDFFDNTTRNRIYNFFRHTGWNKNSSTILTNICCLEGRLPQGSPSSPMLTNLINHQLDARLHNLTKKLKGTYTRYADDLTFSFSKFTSSQKTLLYLLPQILSDYGYTIQKKKKIRILRSHQKQTVTGLIVNQKINLDRRLRRQIRAMEHHHKIGKLPQNKLLSLKGYRSLLSMTLKSQS